MTREEGRIVHRRLAGAYGEAFTKAASLALFLAYESEPFEDYQAAVEAHIMDPIAGRDAPTPASIRAKLDDAARARRSRQDGEHVRQQVRDWQAEAQHKDLMRKPIIKAALEAAADTRAMLVKTYKLDCRCPVDEAVVMGVLTDAMAMAKQLDVPYLEAKDAVALAPKHVAIRDGLAEDRIAWIRKLFI